MEYLAISVLVLSYFLGKSWVDGNRIRHREALIAQLPEAERTAYIKKFLEEE